MDFDWDTIGRRVSLLRHRKGQSIRTVAALAGIDKNTLVRLESGCSVRVDTLHRVCGALGTSPGRQMLELAEPSELYRVSRARDRRWEIDPQRIDRSDPAGETAKLQSELTRWRLGWSGDQSAYNGFLDCELFGGAIVASVIELFEKATLRSFEGEELIYCIRGEVLLEVESQSTILEVGDAASIWAAAKHSCQPLRAVQGGAQPPMILSVRVETGGGKT